MMNRAINQGAQAGRNQPVMSDEELNNLFNQPAAQNRNAGPQVADRAMTYDDVMMKTGVLFAILLAGAVVGWLVPMLALPAALIALVLGLVNAFKKEPSKALIIGYAAFEASSSVESPESRVDVPRNRRQAVSPHSASSASCSPCSSSRVCATARR